MIGCAGDRRQHNAGGGVRLRTGRLALFGNVGAKPVAERKDRRVERTQQQLREALFSLMQEKGFDRLSVQEIIDRANVGRATFYAHFTSKNELLVSGFEMLLAALRQRQQAALAQPGGSGEHLFAFSHELFAHADAHRRVFHAVVRERGGSVVKQQLHWLLVESMREDVRAALPGPRSDASEALVQFLAGAFFGLLIWWLEEPAHLPVHEVDRLFRALAVPALQAARSGGF